MPEIRRRRIFSACVLIMSAAVVHALSPLRIPLDGSLPPTLYARSAMLIEARTGAILFEERADEPVPPASLTKLMTLHIVLDEIAAGRLDPAEHIVPGPDAWARNMPPRSSVMFLGPRQRLTVGQLLQGLVVVSGNDAAVALADRIAGSVPGFVGMMNSEAARLGYREMHFVDPAGISSANTITAREYTDFCRRFIEAHPEALRNLFSLKEFTYPLPENLTQGNRDTPITQPNRNVLLGRYDGVDGLKTGYIDESGYNIAATAARGGMRLISVILGVPNRGRVSGGSLRIRESVELLDYGFGNFAGVQPPYADPAPVKVWKGRARSVLLRPAPEPYVVIPRNTAAKVRTVVEQRKEVVAPVRAGQVLGHIVVTVGGEELAWFPLVAGTDVAQGGILRRAVDSFILLFHAI